MSDIKETARLSADERVALRRYETEFAETAGRSRDALRVIRDRRLYREAYATFEGYCAGRWGLSDEIVKEIIDGAFVGIELRAAERLREMGVSPNRPKPRRVPARAAERAPVASTATIGVRRTSHGTITIHLGPEDLEWAEKVAAGRGISVSGYIRDLIWADRKAADSDTR